MNCNICDIQLPKSSGLKNCQEPSVGHFSLKCWLESMGFGDGESTGSIGGSGGGDNFATADLTLTGDRLHSINGNSMTIVNNPSAISVPSGMVYEFSLKNEIKPFPLLSSTTDNNIIGNYAFTDATIIGGLAHHAFNGVITNNDESFMPEPAFISSDALRTRGVNVGDYQISLYSYAGSYQNFQDGVTATQSSVIVADGYVRLDADGGNYTFTNIPAYANDADAGSNGLTAGRVYQTDGTGTAPLNVAGILMIKQ